eukprot:CAMPEP_0197318796 /NCGR_PEP_ID=MMETSP0891-20130614/52548_1 /TAXON_ID=44058 ORGANISM="Aureoumbra lagunensis, Strain CCMP1510" /NCGR_SAMPLE_ID=MMETSP0891 /ASSEMBLY_ACC=CAM_ASM_000534 /LENGTH=436 /DNA_ID=CAMNT_0042809425 /DNA_START=211 /DNA_END=1521 /DNA_ORIENTATION=+
MNNGVEKEFSRYANTSQPPWYFKRSHRETSLFSAEDEKQNTRKSESVAFAEKDGNSEVRCVVASQHFLVWRRRPQSVLILAKQDAPDADLTLAAEFAKAVTDAGSQVWLAQPLYGKIFNALEAMGTHAHLWRSKADVWNTYDSITPVERTQRPDVVATLGGDGLLLYANALFQDTSPPPIVAIAAGSMGFLAPFDADRNDFHSRIEPLLRSETNPILPPNPWPVSLRMRLRCILREEEEGISQDYTRDSNFTQFSLDDQERQSGIIDTTNQLVVAVHECLNEVVIDRGTSRFLSAVQCCCNGQVLTTIQADGCIVSTPTGSTAYSMSAGGPMLHPSSPCMLLTPICPHSLSFRPIVFPDSAQLIFRVDPRARGDAWITLDGRTKLRMKRGSTLEVIASPLPLPTLLRYGNTADWFDALQKSLLFNTRPLQKPYIGE